MSHYTVDECLCENKGILSIHVYLILLFDNLTFESGLIYFSEHLIRQRDNFVKT